MKKIKVLYFLKLQKFEKIIVIFKVKNIHPSDIIDFLS